MMSKGAVTVANGDKVLFVFAGVQWVGEVVDAANQNLVCVAFDDGGGYGFAVVVLPSSALARVTKSALM